MRILWRRLDHPGMEFCQVEDGAHQVSIRGTVMLAFQGDLCCLEYSIDCDPQWRTQAAWIRGSIGRREVDMRLEADRQARWLVNGARAADVDGCIDIDLGFSPSTNILPMRRLALVTGKPVDVTACWVEFPSLSVKPLVQTYRRMDDRTVHYESSGGSFTRDLETDASGVVLNYPGFWEAAAVE